MASGHRQKQTMQFHVAQNPKDTNDEKINKFKMVLVLTFELLKVRGHRNV